MAKLKEGTVVESKMAKTAVVEVASVHRHPLYLKAVKRMKKFHVHDGLGVKVGDRVEFKEIRPISATKRWTIVRVLVPGVVKVSERVVGVNEEEKAKVTSRVKKTKRSKEKEKA